MAAKLAVALAVLGAAALFAGCHGARETEDVAYITALGIDRADNGQFKLTYTVEIPRAVGSTSSGGQEVTRSPVVVNSLVAPSVAEGRNLLASTMSRYSSASHLKAIIISEGLARAGIRDIVAPFTRFREYRGTIFLFVVNGRAEDFLLRNIPKIDYLPSKWYETMMVSASENAYYLRSDVHEVYLGLKNPGRAAAASYLAINPLAGRDRPLGPPPPGTPVSPYAAGDIPRTGTENPAEVAGIAAFAADKMVGVLSTTEARTLAILDGRYRDGRLVIDDPLQPGSTIHLRVRNGRRPEIRVSLAAGRETVRVKVFLEAELTANPSGINYESDDYRKLMEEQVSALVTRDIDAFVAHTQLLGSDVFGFGRFLRSRFTTYDQLEAAGIDGLYRTAAVEVAVTTSLRRSGLMWRTAPFKNTAARGGDRK